MKAFLPACSGERVSPIKSDTPLCLFAYLNLELLRKSYQSFSKDSSPSYP
jgi:hypothetical protein